MKSLRRLRCAFSFFTIIPADCADFELGFSGYVAIIGAVIGAIAGAAFYIVSKLTNTILGAASAIALILLLSGFTHLDGVLDTGDAIMIRGDKRKKIEVLKDHYLGAGGFGFAFIIYLLAFASMISLSPIDGLFVIVMAEVLSKNSFLLNTLHSNELVPGGLFTRFRVSVETGPRRQIVLNYLVFVILASVLMPSMLIAGGLAILLSYLIKWRLNDSFGGMNGDILGFLGELTRMLFILSAVFLLLFGGFHVSPLLHLLSGY